MFLKSYPLMCKFYSIVVVYMCIVVICLLFLQMLSGGAVEPDTRSVAAIQSAVASDLGGTTTVKVSKEAAIQSAVASDLGGTTAVKVSKEAAVRNATQSKSASRKQGSPPDNITANPQYNESVINPHPFHFTITNPGACLAENGTGDRREVFVVILVKCRPKEALDRQQIRQTWGGVGTVLGRRTKTMFLLGRTLNANTNQRLEAEDDKHRDLIQEDFIDSYGNMTFKSTMGLRWVSLFCPRVSYVLSIDSDMTLNILNLVKRLIDMPRSGFAEGNLRIDLVPNRHRSSKWYTPLSMYPGPTYAPFLNGGCYAMSADVAVAVFRESVHVRFIPWDDVFIGMVMKRAGVQPRRSALYQQYNLPLRHALKQGIAIGIEHNVRRLNDDAISVWMDEVGKHIRNQINESSSP